VTTVFVAAAIGLAIFLLTVRVVAMIATGPPAEPDLDAVEEVEESYLCTVCGMQLTVTYAQGGDPEPPRHCREDMVPIG
jgi:hypothetical protein